MVEPKIGEKFKSNKLQISLILLAADALALILAAITAFNFRFRSSLFETEIQPSIASIDYGLILGLVVLGWLATFGSSGIYRLNHNSLFILNLQGLIKRSLIFFFSLGFLSFVTRASFSRTVFIVLLLSGLLNLILIRSTLQ